MLGAGLRSPGQGAGCSERGLTLQLRGSGLRLCSGPLEEGEGLLRPPGHSSRTASGPLFGPRRETLPGRRAAGGAAQRSEAEAAPELQDTLSRLPAAPHTPPSGVGVCPCGCAPEVGRPPVGAAALASVGFARLGALCAIVCLGVSQGRWRAQCRGALSEQSCSPWLLSASLCSWCGCIASPTRASPWVYL